ncbi:MAG: diguanylate cyclase [Terracidiphilus sp.]
MQTPVRKMNGILRALMCGFAVLAVAVPSVLCQQFSFSEANEGLGDLNVNSIAQDRSGYLWVGTENGLYRYDGRQYRRYGAGEGLKEHAIQSLFVGPDGTLWVGTTAGIYFSLPNGRFVPVNAPAPYTQFSLRIGTVFTAVSANEIITADRSGAFRLRHLATGQWAAEAMHLEGSAIWSVLSEPGGNLWYGCDRDLCQLAGGKTTHLGSALHLPEGPWHHLLLARDGHLWMRSVTDLGEMSPAESRFELHNLPGHSNYAPYVSMAQDAQGRIVASQGPSFGLFENGRWRMVTAANGLSRYDISTLFVDRENSTWIGMVGHGLKRWVGEDRWEAYTVESGLSDDIVWATLRDQNGRLWVGTESGLDYIPAGEQSAKTWQGAGIETVRADSLAESVDGGIWMGSAAGNLVRIDPKTLSGRQWKLPEVYRILSDGGNHLWVATDGGLYLADTATGDHAPSLVRDKAFADPGTRITDLSLDTAKHLWAASDGGLFRLDDSGWHRIDPGLSGINPFHIAADPAGNLWATSTVAGLTRLRIVDNRILDSEHIPRAHLLSDQVVSLAVDKRGWLWVGQDAGLTVFDGHRWRSYTQDDGLIWNDLDAYALAEDPDGSLWIGTSGGLAHFLTPQTNAAVAPQAPVFSRVAFGGASIANGETVQWSADPFTISIASLSFRDARHTRVRYRLVGLESEWVETAENTVRYARLDPGNYLFQAQTLDGAGGLVSPVSEIAFSITPRWWQRGILGLGLALLAGIGVMFIWRGRIQLLLGQKRQLEKAVQTRTLALEQEKTELLRTQEKMRRFAERDDLTGLWNHRIVIERLRQEVDRSQRDRSPLTVILVDLDHFKEVNDTFGHPAGDMVLKEISNIFQRSVRNYDSVGRYGGEEFILILPGSSFVGARLRSEQLRMAVQAARILYGDTAIQITASFGVASGLPPDHDAIIQAADAALYRAKNSGRNCVIATEIEPELMNSVSQRQTGNR